MFFITLLFYNCKVLKWQERDQSQDQPLEIQQFSTTGVLHLEIPNLVTLDQHQGTLKEPINQLITSVESYNMMQESMRRKRMFYQDLLIRFKINVLSHFSLN